MTEVTLPTKFTGAVKWIWAFFGVLGELASAGPARIWLP